MKPAPTRFFDILKHLGPGIIIAGSIVGSGELIATTLVGAKTGFVLLWLILLGCVIKVFTLIEFGRNTIIHINTSATPSQQQLVNLSSTILKTKPPSPPSKTISQATSMRQKQAPKTHDKGTLKQL